MSRVRKLHYSCPDPNNLNFASVNLRNYLIGGKYKIIRRIGRGSFGVIFMAINRHTLERVAIKMEKKNARTKQLIMEYKINLTLNGICGFARVYNYCTERGFNAMTMDLLGPSLQDCFIFCKRSFSLKTILMLVEQIIIRIEQLHKKHMLHRDIKPENFLIGAGRDSHRLYLIDFGLATRFRDPSTNLHMPLRDDQDTVGTARYASVNAHRGLQQSRRDDMLSIGYVVMYLKRGELPWQHQVACTRQQQMEMIFAKKSSTSFAELCAGSPVEFQQYFNYCDNLEYDEEPDYLSLRRMFRFLFQRCCYKYDFKYDWRLSESAVRDEGQPDGADPQPAPDTAKRYKKEHTLSVSCLQAANAMKI